ncbi:unnamed protein product, partial [Mycena citricolor]
REPDWFSAAGSTSATVRSIPIRNKGRPIFQPRECASAHPSSKRDIPRSCPSLLLDPSATCRTAYLTFWRKPNIPFVTRGRYLVCCDFTTRCRRLRPPHNPCSPIDISCSFRDSGSIQDAALMASRRHCVRPAERTRSARRTHPTEVLVH